MDNLYIYLSNLKTVNQIMSYLQNIIIPKIFEAHTANVADVSDLFVTNF